MKIKKVRFIKSMVNMIDHPDDGYPEIAIAGKSNVGKSSLINYLCNHKKMAKISSTPGKTRLLNFFLINEEFYLVDLPGYGFAKVAKSEKKSWAKMIEGYLLHTRALRAIMILVDIRHKPANHDMEIFNWAAQYSVPVICVATKADKIAKSKRFAQLKMIREAIGYGSGFEIYPISSSDKHGKEKLLDAMESYLVSEDMEDLERDEDIQDEDFDYDELLDEEDNIDEDIRD